MSGWQNYYVILGSAAAALISIQFVVITLAAALRTLASEETIAAFGTPTVRHLTIVLMISALMTAPWLTPASEGLAATVCGLSGLVYCAIVVRRTRRQTLYQPVWEDWIWHVLIPAGCYAALALTSLIGLAGSHVAGFLVAGSTLTLLVVGIHNAWDAVTHMVLISSRRE